MNNIFIEEKYILQYIKDILRDLQQGQCKVNFAKYHHNTSYQDAPSICRNGILTMQDLKKAKIKDYPEYLLKLYDDISSHVNGITSVSLSVVGLQDLCRDELEYNPFNPNYVDILVSSDVSASRSSTHYGNEFLSKESICVDKLKSIDIRLLSLVDALGKRGNNLSVEEVIKRYNLLKDIALVIKTFGLDLPLREMSFEEERELDIDKTIEIPKLILKK